MKLHYLECLDGKKLFSFHVHDYQEYTDKKGNYYSLDGGFDYIKYSHPVNKKGINLKSPIKEAEISELIKDIRKQFTWIKRYNKQNKLLKTPIKALLKDLDTNHIVGILKYFTEKLKEFETKEENYSTISKSWKATQLIFLEELLYRKVK